MSEEVQTGGYLFLSFILSVVPLCCSPPPLTLLLQGVTTRNPDLPPALLSDAVILGPCVHRSHTVVAMTSVVAVDTSALTVAAAVVIGGVVQFQFEMLT